MKEIPGYWAVIPANVRYDNRLTLGARMMFGEIEALRHKEGYCYAKNKYFAELYEVSERTISDWISKLKKFGYIKTYSTRSNNGTIRKIYVQDETTILHQKKFSGGVQKKTSINNTIN